MPLLRFLQEYIEACEQAEEERKEQQRKIDLMKAQQAGRRRR